MAKVKVVGNVVLFKSGYSKEDLELIQNECPDTLKMKDPDTGDLIFQLKIGKEFSVSRYGICLNGSTLDEKRLAIGYKALPADVDITTKDEAKSWLVENYGTAITRFRELETSLQGVIEELKKQRKDMCDSIQFEE